MKIHSFNLMSLSKIMLFAMIFLSVTSCKKDDVQKPDIEEPIEHQGEKYLHKIETYTSQDMNTASSIITFEYTASKKLFREIITRYTSNNVLTSTYEYEYTDGKISKVHYSEATTSYRTTETYDYNGDRIIGKNIEYNNGNPEVYKRFTYHEDENYYEVRDGMNRDYWYLTKDGDLAMRALHAISPVSFEYDENAKGGFYAFREDMNTIHVLAMLSKSYNVRPRTKTINNSNEVEYENKLDKDGYLIESMNKSGAYSKTIYTYY